MCGYSGKSVEGAIVHLSRLYFSRVQRCGEISASTGIKQSFQSDSWLLAMNYEVLYNHSNKSVGKFLQSYLYLSKFFPYPVNIVHKEATLRPPEKNNGNERCREK